MDVQLTSITAKCSNVSMDQPLMEDFQHFVEAVPRNMTVLNAKGVQPSIGALNQEVCVVRLVLV